jgi:hypothetical protein
MKKVCRTVLLLSSAIILYVAVPSRAEARMFSFWAEGRGDVFSGSSDLFSQLESPFGGGLEIGFEIIEISLIGELLAMADDWWLYTVHIGVDFDFGEEDSTRFILGLYTGIMIFEFPEIPSEINFDVLTREEQQRVETRICENQPRPCDAFQIVEAKLNQYSDLEDTVSGWAFGYNIIRLRFALDYPVAKLFYLGLAAQLGYHLIVTGADFAAEGKNQAIDSYASNWPPEEREMLRRAVGAEPINVGELDGLNYGIHIYARFEVGL